VSLKSIVPACKGGGFHEAPHEIMGNAVAQEKSSHQQKRELLRSPSNIRLGLYFAKFCAKFGGISGKKSCEISII